MSLDPQAQLFLDKVNELNNPPIHTLGATGAREAYAARPDFLAPAFIELFSVEDRIITYNNLSIPTRIYTPTKSEKNLPACVFYHGGGMVIGTLDGYDTLCRQLAFQSQCIIISIDYRLAPEHKFPAAVDDAFAAYQWVCKHAPTINADPNNIAVSGDSAGGNLAAVVCLMAKTQQIPLPRCQVLIYPATAPHANSDSHIRFATGYFLERDTVLWFHESYINSDDDRNDYRYAPLIAESLSDLPPALIIVAGYDTLRDEGIAYATRLQSEGVDVELTEYCGMFHPFVSLAGILDDGKRAITHCAKTLHHHLY